MNVQRDILDCFILIALIVGTTSYANGDKKISPNYDKEHYKVLKYGESLVLECKVSEESTKYVMKWYKNYKPLVTNDDKKVVVEKNSVRIYRAMENDVANYTCQLVNPEANNSVVANETITVVGLPYVKLPESVSVVEYTNLTLKCEVLGNPIPTVIWRIGEERYKEDKKRVTLSSDPNKSIKNNILHLENVTMADRGEIFCTAENLASNFTDDPNEAVVFIRVKGRYAAVWPFLGIFLQVVVLLAVIVICKKVGNKEPEDSDTDQGPKRTRTLSQKDDGGEGDSVRRRNNT